VAGIEEHLSPAGTPESDLDEDRRPPLGMIAALAGAAALTIALWQGGPDPSAPVLMAMGLGGLALIGGKRPRL
jgi:MYXO-CTERM domain-containing protein